MTKAQKFRRGDHVRIQDRFPAWMAHLPGEGAEAIVVGSYADQFGGSDTRSYMLHFKGHGEVAWYYEEQLTLIERGRLDLLSDWQSGLDEEIEEKSDLDWIFEHGPEVADKPVGASIQALADSKGLGDLWGSRGEGVVWMQNALSVMAIAKPYLMARDKAGWMDLKLVEKGGQA